MATGVPLRHLHPSYSTPQQDTKPALSLMRDANWVVINDRWADPNTASHLPLDTRRNPLRRAEFERALRPASPRSHGTAPMACANTLPPRARTYAARCCTRVRRLVRVDDCGRSCAHRSAATATSRSARGRCAWGRGSRRAWSGPRRRSGQLGVCAQRRRVGKAAGDLGFGVRAWMAVWRIGCSRTVPRCAPPLRRGTKWWREARACGGMGAPTARRARLAQVGRHAGRDHPPPSACRAAASPYGTGGAGAAGSRPGPPVRARGRQSVPIQ